MPEIESVHGFRPAEIRRRKVRTLTTQGWGKSRSGQPTASVFWRRRDLFAAGARFGETMAESSNFTPASRISRKRRRLDDITTPGLRWTVGGKGTLPVRLSAISRTAI